MFAALVTAVCDVPLEGKQSLRQGVPPYFFPCFLFLFFLKLLEQAEPPQDGLQEGLQEDPLKPYPHPVPALLAGFSRSGYFQSTKSYNSIFYFLQFITEQISAIIIRSILVSFVFKVDDELI